VLLDRGADPVAESNDGHTPLHSALASRAEGVVSRLLDAGAGEHLTPLHLSALQGDLTRVEQLLAEGADPNEADRVGWGPLRYAVPFAGLEVVSALLAAGSDPDGRTVSGGTALHSAVSQATVPVVSALLSAGADPNARMESGRSPLHSAAQYREENLLPVINSFLEAGADPRASDDYGNTVLLLILRNPEVTASVVEALLQAGADPMARSRWGNTPLHIAAERTDDVAIIEALLAAGADLRAENEDGDRPVDLAWDIHGSEAYWRLVVPKGTLVAGATFNGSLTSSDAVWDDGSHYDVWTVPYDLPASSPASGRGGAKVRFDYGNDGKINVVAVPLEPSVSPIRFQRAGD